MATSSHRFVLLTILLAFIAPLPSCASKNRVGLTGDERSSLADAAPDASAPRKTNLGKTNPAKPERVEPVETAPPPELRGPPVRVLFIGNSYTFYNGGVDAVLQALGRAAGRNFECDAVTSGGKTLEWHWEEGDARSRIARGGWDYVVLQEFSNRPIADPNLMFEFARKFDAEIKAAGAKTVFFMTWARFHQPENQQPITRAYDKISEELGAAVARVGRAWERVLEQRPSIKLYADDRSHPAPAGTYLAACVFYATLTGESPEGLPATITTAGGKTIDLDPADARVLQRAAAAVTATPARSRVSD